MTAELEHRHPLAIVVFAALALLILYAAGRVIAPYITPIIFGLILVTFTFPLYRRLRTKLNGRQNLAAIIMLLGISLVLVLPAALLIFLLVQQATSLFRLLQDTDLRAVLDSIHLEQRLAWLQAWFPEFDPEAIELDQLLLNLVRLIPGWVAAHGAAFFAGLAYLILGFFLTLLAAFYFYVQGEELARELIYISPLPDEFDQQLFQQFRGVIDATFRGQVLTALAQGAATSIGLAIAGIPGAIFWGAVAAVFGIIPLIGPALVWVPAAAYLLITASAAGTGLGYGIFLVIWGLLVVSTIDNVIRPWAMRGGMDMPAILLFFSILGGLHAFGFVGILLGPLVFALVVTIARMYKLFFARTLAQQNDPMEAE
jgi:predicted PurR-regulated permease PerM